MSIGAVGLPFLDAGQAVDCMALPGLFDTEGKVAAEDLKDARRVCNACPAVQTCGEWAVKHEDYGIWAGTTPGQRRALRLELGITLVDVSLRRPYGHDTSRTPVEAV